MRPALRLIAVLAVVGAGCARVPGQEVPYVQTPDEVVVEMLKLAGVGVEDVVYDLGAGDGRLVITAAKRFGARGVGVEIDPRLVADSQASARKAGVADRVTFVQQNLFDTDLTPATVVTLYLSVELNRRLRPKLLRELRAGSRIVSHDFDMGDWTPARLISVQSRQRTHTLYLWIVPPRP